MITEKYKCNGGISCSLCNAINVIWIEKACIMDHNDWQDEKEFRNSCTSYTLEHPHVRCADENDNGEIRYCQEVYCARGKYSENCISKYDCKDQLFETK